MASSLGNYVMYFTYLGKRRLCIPSRPISYCSSSPLILSISSITCCSCAEFRRLGIYFVKRPKYIDLTPRKERIRSGIMSVYQYQPQHDVYIRGALLPGVGLTEGGFLNITQSSCCVVGRSDRNPDPWYFFSADVLLRGVTLGAIARDVFMASMSATIL